MVSKFVIIIPSRMDAVRLPGKPLADINGLPMIIRVAKQAADSKVGLVYIACGDKEIYDTVLEHGYNGIMTDPSLPSGTDRVWSAFQKIPENESINYIINVQGDLPNINPETIKAVAKALESSNEDISTAVCKINDTSKIDDPSVVKAIITKNNKALYFSRNKIPYGDGIFYEHLGLYGYKKEVMKKFVSLEPSPLELRERLEQLRAMEHGYNITACIVNDYPISIDTPADLKKAREEIS